MPNPENLEGHKFKKGTSGNPKGRPKGTRNRATIVSQWLSCVKNAKNPISEIDEDLEIQDLITLALISKALKGDVGAYKELMDSSFGKVPNSVDVTTNGESIMSIESLSTEELIKRADALNKLNDKA